MIFNFLKEANWVTLNRDNLPKLNNGLDFKQKVEQFL